MAVEQRADNCLFHCGIYMDWLNIRLNGCRDLNFDKLLRYVRSEGGFIRTANFYTPAFETNGQMRFHDAIRKSGFRIVTVPGKKNGEIETANCDVMMAVDMVTQGAQLHVVYILSNDADFLPAVVHLQSKGVRVILLHADHPSNQLRDAVDEWHALKQLELVNSAGSQSENQGY